MRVFGQLVAILCVCGTFSPESPVQGSQAAGSAPIDDRAAKVLADARAALGGEPKLGAITSFTTTGRTQRVQGDNLVPIEFEILVELPDKYLRKDEIPAQESDPATLGFNGAQLLQIPAPSAPEPRPGMPAPPPGQFENMLKARAVTARQDFARLMLGLFATSTSAYPLTFKYIGQAEAPQGKAHVLEGTGENNFKIRYFVHMDTNLPVMVSWSSPARPAPPVRMPAPDGHGAHSAAPPAKSPAPSTQAPAPPAKSSAPSTQAPAPSTPGQAVAPPENRLYFADFKTSTGSSCHSGCDAASAPTRLKRPPSTVSD